MKDFRNDTFNPAGSSKGRRIAAIFLWVVISTLAVGTSATAKDVALNQDLSELVLLKSSRGKAVIRFGSGPLQMVSVGDYLGRHQAEIKEIEAGRMVLEESFTGADGNPNGAHIILKDGQKGGKRYLLHPQGAPLPATRPMAIIPPQREKQR